MAKERMRFVIEWTVDPEHGYLGPYAQRKAEEDMDAIAVDIARRGGRVTLQSREIEEVTK